MTVEAPALRKLLPLSTAIQGDGTTYSDPNRYPTVWDVSHYNNLDVDYLKTAWGSMSQRPILAIVAKASELSYTNQPLDDCVDDKFASHIQTAYDLGCRRGAYMFLNCWHYAEYFKTLDACTYQNDQNILAFRQALMAGNGGWKAVDFYVIDWERIWVDYGEYYEYLQGKRPYANVAKIGASWMLNGLRKCVSNLGDAMKAGFIPKKPCWELYSARWVADLAKMPDGGSVYDDTPKWNLFEALFPVASKQIVTDWGKLIVPPGTSKPSGMNTTPVMWQHSDKIYYPMGKYGSVALDTSICMRSRTDSLSLWGVSDSEGGGPVIPPTPVDTTVEEILAAIDALKARVDKLDEGASAFISKYNS